MAIGIFIILKAAEVVLITASAIGVSTCLMIRFKYRYAFNIKGKTIRMQRPDILADNTYERKSTIKNKLHESLISYEADLRRSAYKNTTLKTNESFFNDSDMESEYYLIIIYDKKSNTPLLSARYYFDKSVIARCLKGDYLQESKAPDPENTLNIHAFKEEELFLLDRLSGNTHCSKYRRHRNYIYLLFYSEILRHNKNCKFVLMARKEKYEKLLTKYIRLGLNIAGSTKHKGKEHWILSGDLKKSYSRLKITTLSNIQLLLKTYFKKYKTRI